MPDPDHPAKFPPELAYRMVVLGADVDDVICDPFAGTGTTLYTAANNGFRYIGIELNGDNALRAAIEGKRGERNFEKGEEMYQAEIDGQKVAVTDPELETLELEILNFRYWLTPKAGTRLTQCQARTGSTHLQLTTPAYRMITFGGSPDDGTDETVVERVITSRNRPAASTRRSQDPEARE